MSIEEILLVTGIYAVLILSIICLALVLSYFEMRDTSRNLLDLDDSVKDLNQSVDEAIKYVPHYLQTLPARQTRSAKAQLKEQFPLGMDILKEFGADKLGVANPQVAAMLDGLANQVTTKVMGAVNEKLPQVIEGILKPASKVISEEVSTPSE